MITDFDKNIPIYLQIEEMIRLAIIKEKYKIGEKLPSVREYAIMLKINPNTINRALLELEEEGLIKTQRTNGKYVTEDKEIIKKSKQEYIKKITNEFINKMKDINVSKKEILELIEKGE
ncbi:MAG: GntR family transcriptional regulator [Bacilli bacterium]